MAGGHVGGTKVVYCFYHANLLYMSRAILAHHKSGAISRRHGFLEDGGTDVTDCGCGGEYSDRRDHG